MNVVGCIPFEVGSDFDQQLVGIYCFGGVFVVAYCS